LTRPDPRWEAFAAREPYFAVLTDPKFLRANLTALARWTRLVQAGQAATAK